VHMTTREIVKKLCKENKVSLNKIEHELGFGSGYISKLGKSKPNSEYLDRISKRFNVSLEYLLTGEDGKYSTVIAIENAKLNKDEQTKRLFKYWETLNVVSMQILVILKIKKRQAYAIAHPPLIKTLFN